MGNCANKEAASSAQNIDQTYKYGHNEDGALETEFETVIPRASSDDNLKFIAPNGKGSSAKPIMQLEHFSFPFENLVFADGGSTTIAYSGVIRVLEEVGIFDKVKRLAGSGIGALVASLLAVGYNSYHIERFLKQDVKKLIFDQTCSVTLLPSLLRTYGWNSGDKLLSWFDSKMNEATGKNDITFAEVHKKFGRELCILVTNLSQMSLEYCHPKTTPDMPVRIAIRMSLSIPGFFQPVSYKWFGHDDIFVDGAVLCKYPVHCFDGWWLSMEPEDCFMQKVPTLSNLAENIATEKRFEGSSRHTLGILLYSDETKANLDWLMEGTGSCEIAKNAPNTHLHRNYESRHTYTAEDYDKLASAFNNLLELLKSKKLLKNKPITKQEFADALNNVVKADQKNKLTEEDLKVLFDGSTNVDDIIVKLTSAKKSQVTYPELCSYMDKRGIEMQKKQLGNRRNEIGSLVDFILALHDVIGSSGYKSSSLRHTDAERTMAINSHYIRSTDFSLEEADMTFLIEAGQVAAIDYLESFISRKSVSLKSDKCKSYNREDLAYFIDDETSEVIDLADYSEDLLRGVL